MISKYSIYENDGDGYSKCVAVFQTIKECEEYCRKNRKDYFIRGEETYYSTYFASGKDCSFNRVWSDK